MQGFKSSNQSTRLYLANQRSGTNQPAEDNFDFKIGIARRIYIISAPSICVLMNCWLLEILEKLFKPLSQWTH